MTLKQIVFLLILVSLSSCKTWKNKEPNELNYMQNIDQITTEASKNYGQNNTIQVGDQLYIDITAKDKAVAKPFNKEYTSSDIIQSGTPQGNIPTQGQERFMGSSYIVDSNGNIAFPILGDINTSGKTLVDLKQELYNKLTKYIVNPTVDIRLGNFKVTILGEVKNQGEYTLPSGQGTLFNALGLAGDLTIYGNREDVLLVRNVDGIITKEKINLRDANFITSPYFYLKQGDVIYVSANRTQEKTSKLNPNTPIFISAAGILVTILALVFRK